MPIPDEYWIQDQYGPEIDNIYMSKIDNSNPMPFQKQNSQPFPQLSPFNQGFPPVANNIDPNFPRAPPEEFPQAQQNPNFPSSNPYSQYPSFGNPYSKYPPDEEEYSSNNQYDPFAKNQQPNQYNPNSQSNPNQYNQNQQAKGFEVINNAYSNPHSNPNVNQYPNKGNDIYSQYNKLYGETGVIEQRSIGSNISNFFSKVWDKTKETTSNIKDKYNDSKFGQTVNSAGHKTVEGMKVAGNKIAETGTKLAVSHILYLMRIRNLKQCKL